MSRPSGGTVAAALAGALVLAAAFVTYHLFDYQVFWDAGRSVLHGRSPYPTDAALARDTRDYFVYPPLTAIVLAPLSLIPFAGAAVIYSLLAAGALVATLRVLGVRDARCYVVLLFWVPALQAVALGTLGPLLALACALCWRYRDRALVGAIVLGVAIAAKIFLWPLGLWLLATRRYRRALETGLVALIALVVPWAAIGFDGLARYPVLLRRLFDLEGETSWSPTSLAHLAGVPLLGTLVELVALLTVVVLARRQDGDRRAFGAAVLAALALSPIVWMHYLVVLLAPLALASPGFSVAWLVPLLACWPFTDTHRSLGVGLWIDAVGVATALFTLRVAQPRASRFVSFARVLRPSPKV